MKLNGNEKREMKKKEKEKKKKKEERFYGYLAWLQLKVLSLFYWRDERLAVLSGDSMERARREKKKKKNATCD